jgi:hypothetical protein
MTIKFNGWLLYEMFFWLVLGFCIIEVIIAFPTLERWKWGYYSLDMIPPVLIAGLLYIINNEIRMYKLENKKVEEKHDN